MNFKFKFGCLVAALFLSASCTTLTPEEKKADALSCLERASNASPGGNGFNRSRGRDRGPGRGRGARNAVGTSEGCRQFFLVWRAANPGGRRDRRNDGVGPLFNAQSCAACHQKGDGNAFLVVQLSVPGTSANGGPKPHPAYGLQIQDRSLRGVDAEAEVAIDWRRTQGRFGDGSSFELYTPDVKLVGTRYGDIGRDALLSPRRIPTVYDTGLFDQVSQAEMEGRADPDDANGDGISGRINWVADAETGGKSVGRFGWKANTANLRQQIAGALHFDMGLTSPLISKQNCAENQKDCKRSLVGGYPEVNALQFDAVVDFTRHLRSPERRRTLTASQQRGAELFSEFGCHACHVPTQKSDGGDVIAIYTDLLLHDMGDGLSDGRPQFSASGSEWRTAPLVGLGRHLREADPVQLLHDGRAVTSAEAILWHGGEGQSAREAFRLADKDMRDALVAYLATL